MLVEEPALSARNERVAVAVCEKDGRHFRRSVGDGRGVIDGPRLDWKSHEVRLGRIWRVVDLRVKLGVVVLIHEIEFNRWRESDGARDARRLVGVVSEGAQKRRLRVRRQHGEHRRHPGSARVSEDSYPVVVDPELFGVGSDESDAGGDVVEGVGKSASIHRSSMIAEDDDVVLRSSRKQQGIVVESASVKRRTVNAQHAREPLAVDSRPRPVDAYSRLSLDHDELFGQYRSRRTTADHSDAADVSAQSERCSHEPLADHLVFFLETNCFFSKFSSKERMSVDPSVLAELPENVRLEVEMSIALSRKSSREPEERKKKKYRQAKEVDGTVQLLCFKCRREPSGTNHQSSLGKFFGASPPKKNVCARCQIPLDRRRTASSTMRRLPTLPAQSSRLKAYKRLAEDSGVPFSLTDAEAFAIMREPCVACGAEAGENGNGISRLRDWGDHPTLRNKAIKGFMGPFSPSNVVTACATCNLMKGYRSVPSFVEAACTIATHRVGQDFGSFPHRFRNNVSKRNRSSYITQSSTHTKTHSLTNVEFNQIVSGPCHYCGKASDPPTHHNGLDRLDSDNRVYSKDTVVSCCGDCNIMKYTHSESFFIEHCAKVARHYHRLLSSGEPLPDCFACEDDGDPHEENDVQDSPAGDSLQNRT